MKTKEFIAKVRSLEFGIIEEGHQLIIRTPGCIVVARVNRPSQQTEIVTFTFGSPDRRELLNIIAEYTGTPSEDREEEKRYRLRKIPITLLREASNRFYRKPLLPNYGPCTSSDITESFQYQTIFTESEISQMDITGFTKEEVE